jgi:hypothetical protein
MATLNFPDAPSTGDVYKDGNSGFSYEWNGTVWISTDPSTASNIRELDNISSGFDGSDTTFTLQVAGVNVEPANVQQLIISVGGVMQNAGDDFTLSGSTLTFTTAPTAGLTFFGTLLGTALSLNTVADGSVGTSSFEQPLTIGDANDSLTIPGNAVVSGILTAANAYVSGILTAKTLNYDNVTDIFSTGIITATAGIQQTGNEGFNNSAGIGTFGSDVHLNGSQAGVTSVTWDASADSLIFQDLSYLKFGAGSDLSIYHDGSNSYISDTGTGSLIIKDDAQIVLQSDILRLKNEAGNNSYITADNGAAVGLRYNNTERLTTADGGVVITGVSTADGFSVGNGEFFRGINNSGDSKIVGGYTAGSNTLRLGESMHLDSNGDLGIGTATMGARLHVEKSGESNILLEGKVAGIGGYLLLKNNDATADSSMAIQFLDAGGQGTSEIKGINADNANNEGHLAFSTRASGASIAERLRITSTGGFQFTNGLFDENVKITAGKLSGNTNIDLADGMVHYFTTQESTTATPNIRINSSISLQTAMDTGNVCTVTLITTAAAAGYAANLTIDGNAVTEEWVGGSAPSEGSADGLDIYTYTIICIGTGTGDSGFKVIANLTNATN